MENRSESFTRENLEQLGSEDGATLAARVLDDLGTAENDEAVEAVSRDTVAAVRALAAGYRDRGVPEPLIAAWRVACQNEMTRVFREFRNGGDAPPIDGSAPAVRARRTASA